VLHGVTADERWALIRIGFDLPINETMPRAQEKGYNLERLSSSTTVSWERVSVSESPPRL